jgi:predicted ATPase/class 3 adenylate cyclase
MSFSSMAESDRVDNTGTRLMPVLGWGDPLERGGEFLLPVGTVTLLLADVEGSTQHSGEAESEMTEAMARLAATVNELIGRHDGVRPVEQGEGDSFVAAFARASNAVACALAIQRALVGGRIALRIGVHTGEVQQSEHKTYVGPAVNRTARLQDAGHGGQVLISRTASDLVADHLPVGASLVDLGQHRLKDLSRPEHIFQLAHPDLRHGFPPLRSLDTYRHNLPEQRTTFFGRSAETEQIELLLRTGRLVTLHGVGGCGKTRLALHVGARLVDSYPDGVFLVELSTLRDISDVVGAVADVVGLGPGHGNALVSFVRDKRVLLVLDNCEHLVDGCAALADRLLASTVALRVLATSRERLAVEGEITFRVPSLAVPPERGQVMIEGVAPYAAAELFIDRARRVCTDFTVTEGDVNAIGDICRRLDGVPLAIELAAARVRALTPLEIAAGLDERFGLLTGGPRIALPRQQTLKASVDWSHDLLTEPERILFRRLGVFIGAFGFDAAVEVCSAGTLKRHQVVDVLMLLVDKSLVVAERADEESRYRLLETLRQYATERLDESDDAEETAARHGNYYLGLAERLGPLTVRSDVNRVRIVRDLSDIRAAYEASKRTGDVETMARFGAALIPYLMDSGADRLFAEVVDCLDQVSLERRAAFAMYWVFTGYHDQRLVPHLEEALTFYRERGELGRAAGIFAMLARVLWHPLQDPLTLAQLDQALVDARLAGDLEAEMLVLYTLIMATYVVPDLDAERYFRELSEFASHRDAFVQRQVLDLQIRDLEQHGEYDRCLELIDRFLRTAAPHQARLAQLRQARCLSASGSHDEAEAAARKSLTAAREADDAVSAGIALNTLAKITASRGDLQEARTQEREAIALLTESGDVYSAPTVVRAGTALAELEVADDDLDAAEQALTNAERIARVPFTRMWVDEAHAVLCRARGQLDEGERRAHAALDAAVSYGFINALVVCLEIIAGIAATQESYGEAARILGAADAIRREKGDARRRPPLDRWHAADIERIREVVGDAEFELYWTQGGQMTTAEAVAYAKRGRGERKRPSVGWASLTPAERQVADLVADGLSNEASQAVCSSHPGPWPATSPTSLPSWGWPQGQS